MNSRTIVLVIVIVGALVAIGYLFHQKAEVQPQLPQVIAPPPPAAGAPDYGSYATAKHPKFPGAAPRETEPKSK